MKNYVLLYFYVLAHACADDTDLKIDPDFGKGMDGSKTDDETVLRCV